VVCNAPGAARSHRKLHRHKPGYYFLFLFSPLVYLIVALLVRKQTSFEMSLCAQHDRRRRFGLWIGWLGTLASIVGLLAPPAMGFDNPLLTLAFVFAAITCPIVGVALSKVITAQRIDKRSAWLHVGRPFLDSFSNDG